MNGYRIGNWHRSFLVLAAVVSCAPLSQALVIDAVADIWLRESDTVPAGPGNPNTEPDANRAYNNDLISVWSGVDSTDLKRNGVVVFDLSSTVGITIDQMYLDLFDLYNGDDGRNNVEPITQEAYILSSTPAPFSSDLANVEAYTWSEYALFDQASEQPFASMGDYDVSAGDLVKGYEASDFGSAADITLLESTRDANSNLVVFILKATAGERDWGDIEGSTPPRLVINEDPPVPGDFTGEGDVTIADYNVLTDPANWLETVPTNPAVDLTADGLVDLRDFKAFKQLYQMHNPGSVFSLTNTVPEPSALATGSLALLCVGFRWLRYPRRSGNCRQ